MWERTASFLRKAWTIILATSIGVWLLLAIPVGGDGQFADTPVDQSAFAAASEAVTPVFAPLGFGSWETSGALVTGFVAKEVVVGTLIQTYAVEAEAAEEEAVATTFGEDLLGIVSGFGAATVDAFKAIPGIVGITFDAAEEEAAASDGLTAAIRNGFTVSSGGHSAPAAMAFLVFVLLYTPCMVAVAAARHEFGNGWMWVSVVGQFVVAWIAAFLVFQGGRLLGM
jgi:ferrous iron transport protein B